MAVPAAFLVIDRAERRRAQLQAIAAITAAGLVDLAVSGGQPARGAIFAAWVATYLASALVITRGPNLVAVVCGLVTAFVGAGSLLGLAWLGSKTASPYFMVISVVPLLMSVAAPEDLLDVSLVGISVMAGGTWLLLDEGRPLGETIVWATIVLITTTFAVVSSLRHHRQHGQRVAEQVERAAMMERLAAAEKAQALAERWAAIGRVADAVAHDVNSPLGSLRSNLAFAREELAAGRSGELDEALADGQAGVERIREIVTSLKAFSLAHADEQEAEVLADRGAPTPPPGTLATPVRIGHAPTPPQGTPEARPPSTRPERAR